VTVPLDPGAVSTTPLRPKPKAPSPVQTGGAAPTPATDTAATTSPPSGSNVGLRNLVLVLVGVAVVVFIVIWLLPSDTGSGKNPIVIMETSLGSVKIELFQDKAPISTQNFLNYVDSRFYDGTIFHRVMADFMIQGGGFTPGMKREKPGADPIRNEAKNGLKNERGTLAMARTGDPNSATSQFFINVVDNSKKLGPGGVDAHGYAVFAKVIDGMDVVDEIRMVQVRDLPGGHEAVPVKDVIIKSIRRAEPKEKSK
jgi:cyclophilin family peptidyl-prolyl cis-trans isomerase